MAKKIYDIMPPKIVNKVEDTPKVLNSSNKVKRNKKKADSTAAVSYVKEMPLPAKKRFPLKEFLFGGAIIIFLLGIYLYNTLPKADIQIWPKTESLTLQAKITIDKSANVIDLDKKIIPAQYIEVLQDDSQEFPATSSVSKDGNAQGLIKVYNKITPATPLLLKAGTHFLSDSGKYFITLQKVTILAAHLQGGKLVAGVVDVSVQAQESGTDYNIGPSKFSVPKLSGTSYYYTIWAESDSAMTGGYAGQVKKVLKDDILQAEDIVSKKLLSQAEDSLKSKLSSDDVLLNSAMVSNIIDSSSDVKPDTIVDKFNISAKAKVSALVFKKQDLEKFAKDYILSQLSNDKTFLEKSLNISYNPELIDVQGGSGTLDLQLLVTTYQNINTDDLIDLLNAKSVGQINATINQMYGDGVSKIGVDFWPFWVKSIPTNPKKVKINLRFQ